jgi:purine-nucleoside phosphorylase
MSAVTIHRLSAIARQYAPRKSRPPDADRSIRQHSAMVTILPGAILNMLKLLTRCLCLFVALLLVNTAEAQDASFNVLNAYAHHTTEERVNSPDDESDWLKKNRFTDGELDHFPEAAIVLHRVDVEKYLNALGFGGFYTSLSYGFTDPSLIYVVRKPGTVPFAVARGLPGAGGITTQVAELHAMGATSIIHVGTCGLLSPDVPYGQLIISDGSYRDGAAFLLDKDVNAQISRPDAALTAQIIKAAGDQKLPLAHAVGFTMPIYYFQPGAVLRDVLAIAGPDKPQFVEMEEAPFFSLAHLMGIKAASIVVGSDRLEARDGKLAQRLWSGDLDALELAAFTAAVHAFTNETR